MTVAAQGNGGFEVPPEMLSELRTDIRVAANALRLPDLCQRQPA
jgi:hypothetical protein